MELFIAMVALIATLETNVSKSQIILLDNNKTSVVVLNTKEGKNYISKPNTTITISNIELNKREVKDLSEDEIKLKYKALLQNSPLPPSSILFYFDEGAELTKKSQENLSLIEENIKKRYPCYISVIGHTDTLGDDEYNIKLSLKRANKVAKYINELNTKCENIKVISYGENDPLVKTKDGVREPKNRRVEVLIK